MARARLMNPVAVGDGTGWYVEADPKRDPPFPDAKRRNWSDFALTEFGAE